MQNIRTLLNKFNPMRRPSLREIIQHEIAELDKEIDLAERSMAAQEYILLKAKAKKAAAEQFLRKELK